MMSDEMFKTLPVQEKIDSSPLIYNGVPVREMVAFPLKLAALIVGKEYKFVYRKVRSGDLKMSPGKLISRVELERFLTVDYFEDKLGKRKK